MASDCLPLEISPHDVASLLAAAPPAAVVVDVREHWEVRWVPFPGARAIPLGELPGRAPAELDPASPLVLVCHHGVRSLRAAMVLRGLGFAGTRSLQGGVDLWRRLVDPTMGAY